MSSAVILRSEIVASNPLPVHPSVILTDSTPGDAVVRVSVPPDETIPCLNTDRAGPVPVLKSPASETESIPSGRGDKLLIIPSGSVVELVTGIMNRIVSRMAISPLFLNWLSSSVRPLEFDTPH